MSFARKGGTLDTPADNAAGKDADPNGVPTATPEALSAALMLQFGAAADLNPARSPGLRAHQIVNHNGDAWVGLEVAPLLGAAQPMTSDLDRLPICCESEPDRDDMRRAVTAHCRQTAEPLAPEILHFLVGERCHARHSFP